MYLEYSAPVSSPALRNCQRRASISDLPHQARPIEVRKSPHEESWMICQNRHALIPPPHPLTLRPDTFDAYVQTMDEWERELLQFVDLRMDPFEFCVELQPLFKAACDGSVRLISQQSAFGWSIRDERGTTVVQGMGPAPGSKPTSYRAEAYGMLSIMRFLIRIAEYTDMHRSWKETLGTDSQSVLDTLSGRDVDPQAEDTPVALHGSKVVLDVLCPNWDILIEIQKSMEQLPDVKLAYVQGHQDRDKPYHTLCTMGQLNVDADRKAAQFQEEHGAYRGIAPLTPGGRVHLLGPKGTIASDYAKKLRYMAAEAPLRLYMLQKYEWCPDIYNSVNWEAHGVALQKLNSRRIHYTKMVHDILPTTHLANKFDQGKRKCPQCQNEVETTRDHVLRCPSPSAANCRTKFQSSLLLRTSHHSSTHRFGTFFHRTMVSDRRGGSSLTPSYIRQVSRRLSTSRMQLDGANCSTGGSVENGAASKMSRTEDIGQLQAHKSERVFGGKPS